ncbi:MAG: hypothetical protein K2V38_16780 [Gemmataceae bacterium]|nr:hypothetical protein [Gemmataceae bacterium]
MNTTTPSGPTGAGRACLATAGRVVLEIEEGRDEHGRRAFEFVIRCPDAAPGERLLRLAPRDLPKLLCAAHAAAGYAGTFADLEPRLAGLMRHVHAFLGEFWSDPRLRWERRVGCPPTES